MKVTYKFNNGERSEVEVSEEVGRFILESRRKEANQARKERYHCYSLDAVAYMGKEYGACDDYGEGSNGKSTFWNSIARVLGTYSGTISADTLTVGCKRNVKPEMAELKGKRLVIAAELEEGMRLNTSVVKQLASTDTILAEKKYKDPFTFNPSHQLVLYTNHLPRIGSMDDGTWRRLIIIPFKAKIIGSSDVKNYTDYLCENAGEYIMSWIIEGAKKAIEKRFIIPQPSCVVEAVGEFRNQNDWIGHFLEDCCEIDPSYTQRYAQLYDRYRIYAQRTGEFTRTKSDFYSALESKGFQKKRYTVGQTIFGLKLREEECF